MRIPTEPGRRAWREILARPGRALVCSDFDGVLSPIVADPDRAYARDATVDALARLGARLGQVAVVTGRPARQAVRLGRLDERPGLEGLVLLGLYGSERWDAATGDFHEPDAPASVSAGLAELPALLDRHGVPAARVEDKRLSFTVHTRELPDPAGAFAALREPVAALAARHGLDLEPGKLVFELRGPAGDKGDAVRALVDEFDPTAVVFAGDDLGDVPAFAAIRELREAGRLAGLLVASGDEQAPLVALADVVVDGPAGVGDLFDALASELDG